MIKILLLFIHFYLIKSLFYGEIINFEDRIFKNNSFLYYYDDIKLYNKTNEFNLKCKNDSDCQKDWCNSGSKCSKEGFCLKLLDYPCPHNLFCNSTKKSCEFKTCFTKYQCNDNIYCNGLEICEDRLCKRSEYPCLFGTCLEKNKSCSYTDKVIKWLEFTKEIQKNSKENSMYKDYIQMIKKDSSYISKARNLTIDDLFNIKISGSPLWDPNSLGVQIAWLVIIIVLFVLVISLCIWIIFRPCCKRRIK